MRKAVMVMDAHAVSCIFGMAMSFAADSQVRADAAELARI